MQNVCLAVLALWQSTAYTHTNYRSVLFCFAWQIAYYIIHVTTNNNFHQISH